MRLGNCDESTVGDADRLGISDEQKSAFAQREVDDGDDLGLRLGQEVDQKVPARYEIETREWRVGEHVVHSEHDVRPQFGRDAVAVILLGEKPRQSFPRHVRLDRFGIEAIASARYRVGIDVGREDLQFDLAFRGVDLLAKQHGERIGLLAGTAAGDPDSERPVQRVVAHKIGNDALGEKFEYRRVTKKAGDIDQQVPGKLIAFVRVSTQEIEILGGRPDPRQRHTPLDAPLERAVLVEREVMNRHRAQDSDHVRQEVLHRLQRGRFRRLRHKDLTALARDQRLRDLRGAEHEIDRAGRDSAARHAVIVGLADVLGDDEAAFRLHRFQPKTAVGPGSGKDHADCARSVFASQRIQEEVERKPGAVSRLRL